MEIAVIISDAHAGTSAEAAFEDWTDAGETAAMETESDDETSEAEEEEEEEEDWRSWSSVGVDARLSEPGGVATEPRRRDGFDILREKAERNGRQSVTDNVSCEK